MLIILSYDQSPFRLWLIRITDPFQSLQPEYIIWIEEPLNIAELDQITGALRKRVFLPRQTFDEMLRKALVTLTLNPPANGTQNAGSHQRALVQMRAKRLKVLTPKVTMTLDMIEENVLVYLFRGGLHAAQQTSPFVFLKFHSATKSTTGRNMVLERWLADEPLVLADRA